MKGTVLYGPGDIRFEDCETPKIVGPTDATAVPRRDLSSATGRLRLLAYIPDRSKQQGRRFPLASISQALSIRFK